MYAVKKHCYNQAHLVCLYTSSFKLKNKQIIVKQYYDI